MTDNPDIRAESELRQRVSSKKIEELQSILADAIEADSDKGTASHEEAALVPRLFAKATVEFLERKTIDDLVSITRNATQVLERHVGSGRTAILETESHDDHSSIYIALADHPFIISSVTECIIDFGGTIIAYLHPILIEAGHRTSLSYIELSRLSPEQLQLLKRRIEETLRHVLLATDDYTAMLVRAETLARVFNSSKYPAPFPASERREIASFLRWLTDGGLIFLGHVEWKIGYDHEIPAEPASSFGVYRSDPAYAGLLLEEVRGEVRHLLEQEEALLVSKLRTGSLVHRRSRLISFTLPEYTAGGALAGVHAFVGLLTSKALSQESSSVPVIRQKLQAVLKAEHAIENSHDYKNIIDIIDSMPKDEALQLDLDSLRDIVHTILGIQNRNETRVSVRFDRGRSGASVLIIMPRDRFNTDVRNRIQNYIEQVFGAAPGTSEYYLDLSAKPYARFYFHVAMPADSTASIDLARMKADIAEITRTWRDNLEEQISTSGNFSDPSTTWYRYSTAFSEEYQALYTVPESEQDILHIDRLTEDEPVRLGLLPAREPGSDSVQLTLYNLGREITISQALPVLENAGFEVINERSSIVRPIGAVSVYLHRFLVRPKAGEYVDPGNFERVIAPGLARVFNGKAENDSLNSLMLSAQLDLRAISLLRAYCGLLWQVNKFASKSIILGAIASTPSAASQLWNMFEIRFNPDLQSSAESRQKRFQVALTRFQDSLREVKDITKDRLLRSLLDLLRHTVRTNFYTAAPAIALKIHSELVEGMPMPRPMYECYVRSNSVEGVHLRSSRIARGGIRWSDRHQDFRSEVVGLLKTQKIKNALIVPAGAKGGFIVRGLPADPTAARQAVEQAYKDFIRCLLSISDNRVQDQVVHPERVVIYDPDDTYCVVAADKGTATFSDLANRIAVEEYEFWLGDAFASGGSQGYDHKKYGITARGAWESAKRHFKNIGLDYESGTFTAVGIGDMSGDVFGNGLLRSDRVRLIGAFNHIHVFVDPNPDPEVSFRERKRLFELPRSQWTDYDPKLISEGGGVFGRFDKEITLTPEIRAALSIPDDVPEVVDGEQLITLILQAKVDLLWNGGIGTYVKARIESNAEVNDGTNDRVRINADELRARVVVEGGNLGFTQRARIEYAQLGGNIQTDAIDNSGGVDLSDHEVNLKILFAQLMRENRLTIEERNDWLKRLAGTVVDLVLENNRQHSLALTIAVQRSQKNIEYFRTLIRDVSQMGYIDRNLEYLPTDEVLLERADKKIGLWKPELAVCLAAVKLWIKDMLTSADLLEDPRLEAFLFDYFPRELHEPYGDGIRRHPLRRNIIATQATNRLVNAVGITFVHRMCMSHSASPVTVIKCTLAAELLLGAQGLRSALERRFDTMLDSKTFLKLIIELNHSLREAAAWLVNYHGHTETLAEMVERYGEAFQTLVARANELLVGEARDVLELRYERYLQIGLEERAAKTMAVLPRVLWLLEMIWTSRESNRPVEEVAAVYSVVMQELQMHPIMAMETAIDPRDKWENELLGNAYDEIRRNISLIAMRLLKRGLLDQPGLVEALRASESHESLRSVIQEVKEKVPTVAAVSVIARLLRNFQA